jgi:hypothetical protein
LQETYPVLPQNGEAQLRVYNGFNCSASVHLYDLKNDSLIKPLDFWKAPTVSADGKETLRIGIIGDSSCSFDFHVADSLDVTEKEVTCNIYMMRT